MQSIMKGTTPALQAEPISILERVIEVLLLSLLTYLPFAMGGVLPFSHVVLMGAALALGVVFALRCFVEQDAGVLWSWAYMPVLLYVVFVALQLVPMDLGRLEALAPASAAMWRDVNGSAEGLVTAPEQASLSVYPWATRVDLRLITSAALILFVVSQVYRRMHMIKRLLLGVSLIGLAGALLALVQDITLTSVIGVFYERSPNPATGGSFFHRGHFCEFTNLAMGAALALLLVRASERRPGRTIKLERQASAGRIDELLVGFLALGALAVALSAARNGLMSMLLGAALMGAIMHKSRFVLGIGWPMIGVFVAGFVGLLFVGFDPVYERMATLGDPGQAYGGRADLARDSISMFSHYGAFGAGQGTFELAFPMFDQSMRPGTAGNADNQYVEILAELGWIGSALILAFLLGLGLAWSRLVRGSVKEHVLPRGVAYGLGFGLFAVAIHSSTDFGIKLPAILVLAGVCAGVILGLSAKAQSSGMPARALCAMVALLGSGSLLGAMPDALDARAADVHWSRAEQLRKPMGDKTPSERLPLYEGLRREVQAAAALQPGKVEYLYWVVLHQWSEAHDREAVAQSSGDENQDGLWIKPSPALAEAARIAQLGLLEVQSLAPSFGPLWSVYGQITQRWLGDASGARWIHLGQSLAPHHPSTCVVSAAQLLREGKEDQAEELFKRAMKIGARPSAILEVLVRDLGRVDFAERLVGDDLGRMFALERWLKGDPDQEQRLGELQVVILEQVELACAGASPTHQMLARLAGHRVSEGRDEEAVRLFRRYLVRDPGSYLRFDLAKALERLGDSREAGRQLRDLLNVHPGHGGARALLDQLGAR